MRYRRELLRGGAGFVALGLAGCVEEEGGEGQGPAGGANETDAADDGTDDGDIDGTPPVNESDEAATGEPAFEIASADVPERTELGRSAEYRFTVVNTGDADGVFRSPVSARIEGGDWSRVGQVELDVRAGGEGIYRGSVAFEYIGDYEIRIDALDAVYEIQTGPRTLAFGDAFTTPNDVVVTVTDLQFRGSYPYYDEDGDRRLNYAPPNRKYAILAVRAENTSAYVRRAPDRRSFVLVAGNDQYEPVTVERDLAPVPVAPRTQLRAYTGGDTYTGVTKRGVILYEVSDQFDPSDPALVSWNESYGGRRVSATWRDD